MSRSHLDGSRKRRQVVRGEDSHGKHRSQCLCKRNLFCWQQPTILIYELVNCADWHQLVRRLGSLRHCAPDAISTGMLQTLHKHQHNTCTERRLVQLTNY